MFLKEHCKKQLNGEEILTMYEGIKELYKQEIWGLIKTKIFRSQNTLTMKYFYVRMNANSGKFKSTYEILLAISQVWDKMSDVDQAALLELIAGKTRGSVVAALLQNGDVLEDSYASASGASGSAMNELDTHLSSIQGRIDLFNNSVQTMWMNFLNSDVLKFIIDFGAAAIKLVDTLGLLPTLLAGLATYKVGKNSILKNLELTKSGYTASDIWKKEKESLDRIKTLK